MTRKKVWIAAGMIALLAVTSVLGTFGAMATVRRAAVDRIYDGVESVPANEVGLVLGTSKFTRGDVRNPHFDHRMEAAARLYHAGRVRHLLLSGDNGTRRYDEPADMRAALLALGVPDAAMTADDAGFRTLDSVVRARKVFGQTRLTIITDRFHAARALFLALHEGVDAVAFPSAEVDLRSSAKSRARECLADVKACLDLWVLHTQPRFLGEPIPVRVAGR